MLTATPRDLHKIKNCGRWIRTTDLRVMSPTSFQTAPSRANIIYAVFQRLIYILYVLLNLFKWFSQLYCVKFTLSLQPSSDSSLLRTLPDNNLLFQYDNGFTIPGWTFNLAAHIM